MVLRLKGGAVRIRTAVNTPGDPSRPLPEAALRDKFRRCVEPAFGARWSALWDMARDIQALPRAAELFDAFRP
jgi:hypothetical protein